MTWKKAIVVGLVLVLVVIGMPILVSGMAGMDMPSCPECVPAVMTGPCAPLVLGAVALLVALASSRLRRRHAAAIELLRAVLFDRPPQLA